MPQKCASGIIYPFDLLIDGRRDIGKCRNTHSYLILSHTKSMKIIVVEKYTKYTRIAHF